MFSSGVGLVDQPPLLKIMIPKEKIIELLKTELINIRHVSDEMLFSIERDKDFPLESDKKGAENLNHWADNVRRLLNEEL